MGYQIWNKTDDIYTPSGAVFTPSEWLSKYRWANIPGVKMVITTGPINGGVAMEYSAMKTRYKELGANITDSMSDEEVLRAIEEFEFNQNKPQEPDNTPTVEERTAAALEFLAMNSLPDAE